MQSGEKLFGRYRTEVLLNDFTHTQPVIKKWLAFDEVLSRYVTVQVGNLDDKYSDNLHQVAQQAAGLTHPSVMKIFDIDQNATQFWIVGEWVSGQSLSQLKLNSLNFVDIIQIVSDCSHALLAGQKQQLSHGWLNPENIYLTDQGKIKIAPFLLDASTRGQKHNFDTDFQDLAGVLFYLLTGFWPGFTPSAVSRPPRNKSGMLRPRQIKPRIPAQLDQLCADSLLANPKVKSLEEFRSRLSNQNGHRSLRFLMGSQS